MAKENNRGDTLDHLRTFLDIPEFEIIEERVEILKYLKAGVLEEMPYRTFGINRLILVNDRVDLYIETPGNHDGEHVGEFHLNMNPEEKKGLWRMIFQKNKETTRKYKEYKKDLRK